MALVCSCIDLIVELIVCINCKHLLMFNHITVPLLDFIVMTCLRTVTLSLVLEGLRLNAIHPLMVTCYSVLAIHYVFLISVYSSDDVAEEPSSSSAANHTAMATASGSSNDSSEETVSSPCMKTNSLHLHGTCRSFRLSLTWTGAQHSLMTILIAVKLC